MSAVARQVDVGSYESPQVVALNGYTSNKRSGRMGMLVLLVGLGGFLL